MLLTEVVLNMFYVQLSELHISHHSRGIHHSGQKPTQKMVEENLKMDTQIVCKLNCRKKTTTNKQKT